MLGGACCECISLEYFGRLSGFAKKLIRRVHNFLNDYPGYSTKADHETGISSRFEPVSLCFEVWGRRTVCPVQSPQKYRASYSLRSSLIHSYGYESVDGRTDCLALIRLSSEPFMNYPG
jgi:hypothetical protein